MLKQKEIDTLIKHYNNYLGDTEFFDYNPTKNMVFKPQLVISRPNKNHPY